MKKYILPIMALLFVFLIYSSAFGDIINVPTPYPTIQAGINAASSGDTVQVAAGTYFENITMKSGVVIQGAGQGVTTINGGGNGSVVTAINVDSSAKLDGFTITAGSSDAGGGMYNENSSPTVANCTFSGNSALEFGGGMENVLSSPTVTNCTFSGNSAEEAGGGMDNYDSSSPTVTNCTFSGNLAYSGGGMYNEDNSSPTVESCTFSENTATWGGGMYSYYLSSPTVANCTFSGNSAEEGGGMLNEDNSSPTVESCTFSGDTATFWGGGMYNYYSSSPTVTNCTFLDNATLYGGGMYNESSSSPTVTNCTFSGNSAEEGGGMLNEDNSSPILTNCILWGDSPEEISNLNSSPSVTYSDIQGEFTGTGNINADPIFVDPDGPDNISGNEDDDYHLSAGSPCIDAGTSSGAPDTDFEGNPRPQGAGYDMGAYEFASAKPAAMPWIPLLLLGD